MKATSMMMTWQEAHHPHTMDRVFLCLIVAKYEILQENFYMIMTANTQSRGGLATLLMSIS